MPQVFAGGGRAIGGGSHRFNHFHAELAERSDFISSKGLLNEPISIRLPSGSAMEQVRRPQGFVVGSKTDTALRCFAQVLYDACLSTNLKYNSQKSEVKGGR